MRKTKIIFVYLWIKTVLMQSLVKLRLLHLSENEGIAKRIEINATIKINKLPVFGV